MRTALSRLGKIARVKAVHPALEMRVNHLTSIGGSILQGLNKRPQINNREAFEAVMRAFEVAAVRHVPKKMANKGRDQGGHWEKAGVLTGSFRPQAHYPRGWQHSGEVEGTGKTRPGDAPPREGPAAQHQSIPHAGGDGRGTLPRDDEGRGEPGAVK
ncbi:hypothetical protein DIPPA_06138 [Diplonema papillatum]|nr:hypothetical protein DIPPA_06138 [Diplonema papillatum]